MNMAIFVAYLGVTIAMPVLTGAPTASCCGLQGGAIHLASETSDVERGIEAARAGDYVTALALILPAAKDGDPVAQNAMGVFHANGLGVTQDYSEALRWYRLSAAQSYASAQYNIGTFYQFGRGLRVDNIQAAEWYDRAAEQGHSEALFHLALLYADGRGVERNLRTAYSLAEMAHKRGHATAGTVLGRISNDLRSEFVEGFRRGCLSSTASAELIASFDGGEEEHRSYCNCVAEFYADRLDLLDDDLQTVPESRRRDIADKSRRQCLADVFP